MRLIKSILPLCLSFILLNPKVGECLTSADISRWQYPTDQEVIDTAIEAGFIRSDLGDDYVVEHNASDWKVWIVRSRAEKRDLVKQMKSTFAEIDEAVILNPNEHYVNEINIRIQNVLKQGNLDYFDKITVPTLFKSLAIIEGDYNDGQTQPLQLIRNWFGEPGIEQMKQRFPERYEQLRRLEKDSVE